MPNGNHAQFTVFGTPFGVVVGAFGSDVGRASPFVSPTCRTMAIPLLSPFLKFSSIGTIAIPVGLLPPIQAVDKEDSDTQFC